MKWPGNRRARGEGYFPRSRSPQSITRRAVHLPFPESSSHPSLGIYKRFFPFWSSKSRLSPTCTLAALPLDRAQKPQDFDFDFLLLARWLSRIVSSEEFQGGRWIQSGDCIYTPPSSRQRRSERERGESSCAAAGFSPVAAPPQPRELSRRARVRGGTKAIPWITGRLDSWLMVARALTLSLSRCPKLGR